MEANEQNINALTAVLTQTVSPDRPTSKGAENTLLSIETQPGYSILLLKIISAPSIQPFVKQIASVTFKNFIRSHWKIQEGQETIINENDRNIIKSNLVELMVSISENNIKQQIAAALGIISSNDFPAKWQSLLPELIKKLGTSSTAGRIGILQTLHSILKRYRHQFKCDAILFELKYILEQIQAPILELCMFISQNIFANLDNAAVLKDLFISIHLVFKIFYDLNCVDLPEYFEENMGKWMDEFHKYLTFETKHLVLLGDEDEPGLLHSVQTAICHNLNLYIGKYEEEVESFVQTFVEATWNLLTRVDSSEKFDKLATAAIGFLTSVATSVFYNLFGSGGSLRSICEKIVIGNIEFRETDKELFKENGLEYIRRDIEGSDSDTRRRAACELVKGLRKNFEKEVTDIFAQHITSLLGEYQKNPKQFWKAKDAALYLVTALTVTGQTGAKGVTTINSLVPIVQFFADNVLPELEGRMSDSLIIKADALKFTTTFRNQLPGEAYARIIPECIKLLDSPNYVVHTYAAICIERLLIVRNLETKSLKFDKENLKPLIQSILAGLFKILNTQVSKENDYVMKTIMRVISVAAEHITPLATGVTEQLTIKLGQVYKNPTNPNFNHYLFECIAVLIRNVCQTNPGAIESFEGSLIPAFKQILVEDIAEFAPYVFQILSFMLELRPTPLPPSYTEMLPPLTHATLWSKTGNVPALVRLLRGYLTKATQVVVSGGHLEPILGIFQKLIASINTDHEGFLLLDAVVNTLGLDVVGPHLKTVFMVIFTRSQTNKTVKFYRYFLVFINLLIGKHGPGIIIQTIDSIQQKLFGMVLENIWLNNINKVTGNVERKICAVGMIRLLTDDVSPFLADPYNSFWGKMLTALMVLLELPEDASSGEDDVTDDIGEEGGYSASYSKLAFASRGAGEIEDPFGNVDVRKAIAIGLQKLSQRMPGKVQAMVQNSLPADAQNVLVNYFKGSGIAEPYLQ